MQNTRLNSLIDSVTEQIRRSLRNPWRRLSLLVISLLFGIFLGSAVATTLGQAAQWDAIAALMVLIFTEIVSWVVYRNSNKDRASAIIKDSIFLEILNALKIGLTYSLFIEAFKLGS